MGIDKIMAPTGSSEQPQGRKPINPFYTNVCFGISLSWRAHQETSLLKIRHSKPRRFIRIFYSQGGCLAAPAFKGFQS